MAFCYVPYVESWHFSDIADPDSGKGDMMKFVVASQDVVNGGNPYLGDTPRRERLCHRSAIQRACRDCVVGCRRLDGYVGVHHLSLLLIWLGVG